MTTELQKIALDIRNNIEAHAQQAYDDGHRTHLGASLIGDDCKRKLWFTFRHVYHHKHSGRMLRLWNTGHCEEARIIGWLRGAGYVVQDLADPDLIHHPESSSYFLEYDFNFGKDYDTGLCYKVNKDSDEYKEWFPKLINNFDRKQFKISDCEGHFGGSTDGVIYIPQLGWCLLECKTSKTGAEFKILFDKELAEAKAKHWAQVCTYGFKLGLEYCAYICKNKNDDDLYIEVVKLDHAHGEKQIEKANEIIFSQEVPERIALQPSFYKCKPEMCDYSDICFKNKAIEHNCRSCKNAAPVANAEWFCSKQNSIIPKDAVHVDYACWESILTCN